MIEKKSRLFYGYGIVWCKGYCSWVTAYNRLFKIKNVSWEAVWLV